MIRFFLGLALCVASFPGSATLVLAIPTRDGLVIAADSRMTVDGEYFDIVVKLKIAEGTPPLVYTTTGNCDFADTPPPGVSMAQWLPVATWQFRAAAFVDSYLSSRPSTPLSMENVAEIGAALASSIDDYFNVRSELREFFRGRPVCQLAVFQNNGSAQIIASTLVELDAQGVATSVRPQIRSAQVDDPRIWVIFGEVDYMKAHVWQDGAQGHRFLPERIISLWNGASSVKDLTAPEAALIAQTVIRATEATSALVPIENGVGGPVQILLITPDSIGSVAPPEF